MAVSLSYPGVYVQEVPSGVRTIVGVSTSIAMFIGRTGQGPLDKPVRCLNYTNFKDAFSEDVSVGDMARYVRLFFLNGGTDCYVMRIANGATHAEVTLQNENRQGVLHLAAKQAGMLGETVRAEVTYRGPHPEAEFNIRLFRRAVDRRGSPAEEDIEEWRNLSMRPESPNYAPDLLTQRSRLVNAEDVSGASSVTPIDGYSQSGRPAAYTGDDAASFNSAWAALIGDAEGLDTNQFEISVSGSPYALVRLGGIHIDTEPEATVSLDDARSQLESDIAGAIRTGLATVGASSTQVEVSIVDGPTAVEADEVTSLLRISAVTEADAIRGDVFIRPASEHDAAVALMLGTRQGGLEVGAYAPLRPAPNGISLRVANEIEVSGSQVLVLTDLASQAQTTAFQMDVDGQPIGPFSLQTSGAGDPFYRDGYTVSSTGNNDGVREKLSTIRDTINDHLRNNRDTFFWRAELWGQRLTLLPLREEDSATGAVEITSWSSDDGIFTENVRLYTVGTGGMTGYQTPATQLASDGDPPEVTDYEGAYETIEREVDLFNLLILPPDRSPAQDVGLLWPEASAFCEKQRAFLLVDPPGAWENAQGASEGVADLRSRTINDYSAVFYPQVTINEKGRNVDIGPAGAIAGVMARIDNSRGVWKAPAGVEADLRGVVGVQRRFSDGENGLLNPRGINTIRVFPNGIVNWGARTLDGDDDFASEWKYIPIRRLALFMEESLYRGLKWVVFEPNDEPLWSQIRLNVGAFMRNLYRQGAFQGKSPKEAYFVKCDSETTTQNDRNLGIVNIWVGFAPLKPAEFVIIQIQQIAGQIPT
jgi:hypothetical protein